MKKCLICQEELLTPSEALPGYHVKHGLVFCRDCRGVRNILIAILLLSLLILFKGLPSI